MDFGDFLWSLLIFYFIFFYFMILSGSSETCSATRRPAAFDKTLWLLFLLFLPFLSLFIYLITNGQAMTERAMARAAEQNAAQQDYIRRSRARADDPTPRSRRRTSCSARGAISQAEFDALKAKALA
jgi:ABC-type dipeptide/oligopeptide/nickel transport system permease component